MKDGYVIKSNLCGTPNNGELSLINLYTRRELLEDEVYVFSVILCDNEIDRDYERFTNEALHKLSKLYVGKTGIIDHDAKSDNQTARIFSCRVEEVNGKLNKVGEKYSRLVARAYMLRSAKNKDFILELDAGIKKEVSVGCSLGSVTCSICGANIKKVGCNHKKGAVYKEKLCHHVLDNPTDAYEWSFVAVPAQKEAGVIKAFDTKTKGGVINMEDVIKQIKLGKQVNLTCEQSQKLNCFISELQKYAEDGKTYRDDLKRDVVKLCSMVQPEIKTEIMDSVTEKMSIAELKEFKKVFSEKKFEFIPPKPQLVMQKKDTIKSFNTEFQI